MVRATQFWRLLFDNNPPLSKHVNPVPHFYVNQSNVPQMLERKQLK